MGKNFSFASLFPLHNYIFIFNIIDWLHLNYIFLSSYRQLTLICISFLYIPIWHTINRSKTTGWLCSQKVRAVSPLTKIYVIWESGSLWFDIGTKHGYNGASTNVSFGSLWFDIGTKPFFAIVGTGMRFWQPMIWHGYKAQQKVYKKEQEFWKPMIWHGYKA